MKRASDVYLSRRELARLPEWADVHRHVMDQVFGSYDLREPFRFNDVVAAVEGDLVVTGCEFATSCTNNVRPDRLRLIVTRALDSLVLVGMLKVEVDSELGYYFAWRH